MLKLQIKNQYLQNLILYVHEDVFLVASFSVLLRTESLTMFLVVGFFLDAIFHDNRLTDT